jgi:hypothetical protein
MLSEACNSNSAAQVEVMELRAALQRHHTSHLQMMLDLEAKKPAFQVDVPTLPHNVKSALRSLGFPVRLFGENLANVQDQLWMELARQEIARARDCQRGRLQEQGQTHLTASEQKKKKLPNTVEQRQSWFKPENPLPSILCSVRNYNW